MATVNKPTGKVILGIEDGVWPYDTLAHSRSEIRKAVKDAAWQLFRVGLKGKSTKDKLLCLERWIMHPRDELEIKRAWVQVDNYINALLRGGQLVREGKTVRVQR